MHVNEGRFHSKRMSMGMMCYSELMQIFLFHPNPLLPPHSLHIKCKHQCAQIGIWSLSMCSTILHVKFFIFHYNTHGKQCFAETIYISMWFWDGFQLKNLKAVGKTVKGNLEWQIEKPKNLTPNSCATTTFPFILQSFHVNPVKCFNTLFSSSSPLFFFFKTEITFYIWSKFGVWRTCWCCWWWWHYGEYGWTSEWLNLRPPMT